MQQVQCCIWGTRAGLVLHMRHAGWPGVAWPGVAWCGRGYRQCELWCTWSIPTSTHDHHMWAYNPRDPGTLQLRALGLIIIYSITTRVMNPCLQVHKKFNALKTCKDKQFRFSAWFHLLPCIKWARIVCYWRAWCYAQWFVFVCKISSFFGELCY